MCLMKTKRTSGVLNYKPVTFDATADRRYALKGITSPGVSTSVLTCKSIGGSLGKGTAVKGKSDLDILFVVNDIKSIEDLMKKIKQIKHELHNALCCGSFSSVNGPLSNEEKAQRRKLKKNKPFKVSDIRRTPFTVSFTMTLPDGTSMPVDLIIVPNLVKSGPDGNFSLEDLTNIYQQMKAHPEQRDYYAKCLSPVQVSFVKNQPEKLKRAIRVTKDWAKSNEHKLSSYAIELLAIKTYENFNRPQPGGITEDKIVNGILEQLKDCKNMKVEWNTNYNLDDYGRPDGPYIMDPANPYHNLFRPKTEQYWINRNESESVILSEPDISRIESDAVLLYDTCTSSRDVWFPTTWCF